MPRSLSTDDTTLADAQILFYKLGAGVQFKVTVVSTDGSFHATHDEDLTAALVAMVASSAITTTQRNGFIAVALELRRRARASLSLTP